MPSRHALSAAVLAAVWLYFYPAAGCVMVGIALLICCLRVLTGVHHVAGRGVRLCAGFCAGLCRNVAAVRLFCSGLSHKKVETFFRFSLTECDRYGIISLAACADTELPP